MKEKTGNYRESRSINKLFEKKRKRKRKKKSKPLKAYPPSEKVLTVETGNLDVYGFIPVCTCLYLTGFSNKRQEER